MDKDINRRPRLTIPSMFKFQQGTFKNPPTISKRVGREVPGVVAVLLSSKMWLAWYGGPQKHEVRFAPTQTPHVQNKR